MRSTLDVHPTRTVGTEYSARHTRHRGMQPSSGAQVVCWAFVTTHLAAAARLNAAVSRVSRAVFSPDGPCWMYVQRRARYGRLSISSPAICAISARVRLVRQEAADEVPTMTAQPMAAPWVVEVV